MHISSSFLSEFEGILFSRMLESLQRSMSKNDSHVSLFSAVSKISDNLVSIRLVDQL